MVTTSLDTGGWTREPDQFYMMTRLRARRHGESKTFNGEYNEQGHRTRAIVTVAIGAVARARPTRVQTLVPSLFGEM
jgi:hypothetical protein